MIRNFLIATVALLPLWAGAQALDEAQRAQLDSLFDLIEQYDQGMGSLSLTQNGALVYQRAIGYADIETGTEATPLTRYRIGSISKSFTAVLVLQAVERGELSLDTKLAKFFPDLPHAQLITVEQLLRHRSGLANYTAATDYTQYMEQATSREELLARFRADSADFEPGDRFAYSNTNYALLTFMLEDLTGRSYAELLREGIVEPLDLNATYYGGPIDPEANEARSYEAGDPWTPATETDMSVPRGAGALVSTAGDLNTFFRALMEGRLLSDTTLGEMLRIVDGYGLGITRFPFGRRDAYGHNGGIDGFQSSATYFPDEGLSVAYLANGVNLSLNDVMIGVLSIYFGRDYELPAFDEMPQLSPDELTVYEGTYTHPDFPLDITITRQGSRLMGQATGQPSFPLRAEGENIFTYEQAGLELEFAPGEEAMILRQRGVEVTLTRE